MMKLLVLLTALCAVALAQPLYSGGLGFGGSSSFSTASAGSFGGGFGEPSARDARALVYPADVRVVPIVRVIPWWGEAQAQPERNARKYGSSGESENEAQPGNVREKKLALTEADIENLKKRQGKETPERNARVAARYARSLVPDDGQSEYVAQAANARNALAYYRRQAVRRSPPKGKYDTVAELNNARDAREGTFEFTQEEIDAIKKGKEAPERNSRQYGGEVLSPASRIQSENEAQPDNAREAREGTFEFTQEEIDAIKKGKETPERNFRQYGGEVLRPASRIQSENEAQPDNAREAREGTFEFTQEEIDAIKKGKEAPERNARGYVIPGGSQNEAQSGDARDAKKWGFYHFGETQAQPDNGRRGARLCFYDPNLEECTFD